MRGEAAYPSYRFTTRTLPEHIRRDAFCDMLSREVLRVQVDAPVAQAFEVDARFQTLPRTTLATGSFSPIKMWHVPALATDDDLVLLILRTGRGRISQKGHAIEVSAGEATVTRNGAESSVHCDRPINLTSLRLERSLLSTMLKRPLPKAGAPISANSPALRLLSSYIDAVESSSDIDFPLAERISGHVYDLAILALNSGEDIAARSAAGAVKAARLCRIKSDIANRLTDHDLSARILSLRHGVSERYVQKLFAEDGTTLSRHIAECRLELARKLLIDTKQVGRQIVDIAYDAGFSDKIGRAHV